jgi:hypothetical protein
MTANAQASIKKLKTALSEDKLAKVAYDYFKQITPVKSGNARNKTVLNNNEINASYPYAQRLDKGWSKQAPQGMVKPTIDYLLSYIKKQVGK